jgi:hypothetical protein
VNPGCSDNTTLASTDRLLEMYGRENTVVLACLAERAGGDGFL